MSIRDIATQVILADYVKAYGSDYQDYIKNVFTLADEFNIKGIDKMVFAEALRLICTEIDNQGEQDD